MTQSHVSYAYTDSSDLSRNTINCLCGGGNLVHPHTLGQLQVNLMGSGFMSITQLVGLTQYLSDAATRGVRTMIGPPSDRTANYLKRMNFYRLLGIDAPEGFTRHAPSGNFVAMIKLYDDDQHQRATDAMGDLILAHLFGGRWAPADMLNMSLSEIMGNIPVHSASVSHGIVGAQYYPSKEIVEICVADSGRGIVASMGDNPSYEGFSDDQKMMCALEEGYGQYYGRPDFSGVNTSAGRGLMYPTRLTKALDGRMWVVSHSHTLEVSGSGVRSVDGLFYPGTLVSLRLRVSERDVIRASQIFTGAADVPIILDPQNGWVDPAGRQIDVFGITGSDDGLW